jgi:hypothetical protein
VTGHAEGRRDFRTSAVAWGGVASARQDQRFGLASLEEKAHQTAGLITRPSRIIASDSNALRVGSTGIVWIIKEPQSIASLNKIPPMPDLAEEI